MTFLGPSDPRKSHDYFVEIWNDTDTHYVRVQAFNIFDEARSESRRLTKGKPDIRVAISKRMHVFDQYLPERLRLRDRRE